MEKWGDGEAAAVLSCGLLALSGWEDDQRRVGVQWFTVS